MYKCECGRQYQHKGNLTRHCREKHTSIEHWICVETSCSTKFIRRGYLAKHLVMKHGYSVKDANVAALDAPRGDNPRAASSTYEDISDDDTILDLLDEIASANTQTMDQTEVSDFNLDLFETQNVDTCTTPEENSVPFDTTRNESSEVILSNNSCDNNSSISVGLADYITISDNESEENECKDLDVPNDVTLTQVVTLTFRRTVRNVNGTQVVGPVEQDFDAYEQWNY